MHRLTWCSSHVMIGWGIISITHGEQLVLLEYKIGMYSKRGYTNQLHEHTHLPKPFFKNRDNPSISSWSNIHKQVTTTTTHSDNIKS